MDVIFARVPAAHGRIGPTLERNFRSGDFGGCYDNAGTGDAIFGAAKDTQRIIAGREFKFGRSTAVKVPVAVIFENTIECARRSVEFSGFVPQRDAGRDGLSGGLIA